MKPEDRVKDLLSKIYDNGWPHVLLEEEALKSIQEAIFEERQACLRLLEKGEEHNWSIRDVIEMIKARG